MRLLLAPAAIVAVSAAQAVALAPLAGQPDVAYAGGVYTRLTVEDAVACAQSCEQDGICMAWTYRDAEDESCELKAAIGALTPDAGARSGLSSRAPDFARSVALAAPVETPAVHSVSAEIVNQTEPSVTIIAARAATLEQPAHAALAPAPMILAVPAFSLPAAVVDQPAAADQLSPTRNETVLLGGPLEGDLRPTLGNAP